MSDDTQMYDDRIANLTAMVDTFADAVDLFREEMPPEMARIFLELVDIAAEVKAEDWRTVSENA